MPYRSASNANRFHATFGTFLRAAAFVAIVALPELALAQGGPAFEGTDSTVKSFFRNINGLLNIASVAVVTIAVIFAGYQIAFAHKRISDVAPILVGGFLIGAAAQIANMLLGDGDSTTAITMATHAFSAMHA
ncbi:MAG: type VI secretion protein [Lysobacter sp.]|nr:MAG: type VI secretion protein [Lysobacter sp.]